VRTDCHYYDQNESLFESITPLVNTNTAGRHLYSGGQHPHAINDEHTRMPMSPGKVLPDKYYKLKRTANAFDWVPKADASDRGISGEDGIAALAQYAQLQAIAGGEDCPCKIRQGNLLMKGRRPKCKPELLSKPP
jgi:hypothetical protein